MQMLRRCQRNRDPAVFDLTGHGRERLAETGTMSAHAAIRIEVRAMGVTDHALPVR